MTQILEVPHIEARHRDGNGGSATTAIARRATVMGALSDRYSMDPVKLLETIKATCIKGNATNEQVQAFLIVANRYGLDPFLKQIHAFAGQGGGIVPIVGIDGWTKIINEQDRFDGMDAPAFADGADGKPVSCTVTIYVKGRTHPVTITEFFTECYRNTAPWNTMPRRMLRHKTLMQCARVAFGLSGIFDEDEARDVIRNETDAPPPARGTTALAAKLKSANPADTREAVAEVLPDTQLPEDEARAVAGRAVEQDDDQRPAVDEADAQDAQQPESPEAGIDPLDELIDQGESAIVRALWDQARARTPKLPRKEFDGGVFKFIQQRGGESGKTKENWKALYRAIVAGNFDFKTGVIVET